jgi:hypothetical protein
MDKIDNIKINYQRKLIEIDEEMDNYNYSVKIQSNSILSWSNMANFIIKLNETNKFVSNLV